MSGCHGKPEVVRIGLGQFRNVVRHVAAIVVAGLLERVLQHLVEFVREGGSSSVGDGGGGVVLDPIVAKVWPKASSGSNCVSFYRAR